jgi:hypothetical protein
MLETEGYSWHGGAPSIVYRRCISITYSLVLGAGGRDGALRTTVARVGGADDLDVVRVGRATRLGVGSSEGWEREGDELGMHLERLFG